MENGIHGFSSPFLRGYDHNQGRPSSNGNNAAPPIDFVGILEQDESVHPGSEYPTLAGRATPPEVINENEWENTTDNKIAELAKASSIYEKEKNELGVPHWPYSGLLDHVGNKSDYYTLTGTHLTESNTLAITDPRHEISTSLVNFVEDVSGTDVSAPLHPTLYLQDIIKRLKLSRTEYKSTLKEIKGTLSEVYCINYEAILRHDPASAMAKEQKLKVISFIDSIKELCSSQSIIKQNQFENFSDLSILSDSIITNIFPDGTWEPIRDFRRILENNDYLTKVSSLNIIASTVKMCAEELLEQKSESGFETQVLGDKSEAGYEIKKYLHDLDPATVPPVEEIPNKHAPRKASPSSKNPVTRSFQWVGIFFKWLGGMIAYLWRTLWY